MLKEIQNNKNMSLVQVIVFTASYKFLGRCHEYAAGMVPLTWRVSDISVLFAYEKCLLLVVTLGTPGALSSVFLSVTLQYTNSISGKEMYLG